MNDFKDFVTIIGAALLAVIGGALLIALYILAFTAPIALVVWAFGKAIGVW